jgi:hypothetical protein
MKTVPQIVLDSVFCSKPDDWTQHANGGGWVYKTAKVDASVYLYGNAQVSGNAQVCGDAICVPVAHAFIEAYLETESRP